MMKRAFSWGPTARHGSRSLTVILVTAFGMVACGAFATPSNRNPPTPSTVVAFSSQPKCPGAELNGVYRRDFTAETTNSSALIGAWTLEVDNCEYRISVDGIEQGVGRLELVDGTASSGRVGLSEELLCPNEFAGVAFYDVSLDGSLLSFAEAIQGTDPCEGRAEAFAGQPGWARE